MRFTIHLLSFILFLISMDGLAQNVLIGCNVNQLHEAKSSRFFPISDNTASQTIHSFDADFTIGYQTDKLVFRSIWGFSTWYHQINYNNNFNSYESIYKWTDTRRRYKIGIGIEKLFTYDKLHFYIGLNPLLIIDKGTLAQASDYHIFNNDSTTLRDFESINRKNNNIRLNLISRMYYELLPNLSIGVHFIVSLNYQFYDDQHYSVRVFYENQNPSPERINNIQQKGYGLSQFSPQISFGLQYQINWKQKNSIDCSGLFNNKNK